VRVIILAGGRGTRLAEETQLIPKPMVEIAGKPMLWHIMNSYARQGFKRFTVATGYLGNIIDDWVEQLSEPWEIDTLFTGLDTQTGGRLRQCMLIDDDPCYFATYGDGLANVNLNDLISFHQKGGFLATLTAVRPPARFGVVELHAERVVHFGEKLQADSGWINGGFFMLNREVVDFVHNDNEPFESGALPRLVAKNVLGGYKHFGFWKPMDTLREKNEYQELAKLERWPWLIDC
jgi:glucose-1-phosphate cytidylyltransferase